MIIEAAVRSKAFKRGNAWEKNLVKGKDKLGLNDFVGHLSLDVTCTADAHLLLALYRECFGPSEKNEKGSIKVFDKDGKSILTWGYDDNPLLKGTISKSRADILEEAIAEASLVLCESSSQEAKDAMAIFGKVMDAAAMKRLGL